MPNMYITKEYDDYGYDKIKIIIPIEKEKHNYLKNFFNEINQYDELNKRIKKEILKLLIKEYIK